MKPFMNKWFKRKSKMREKRLAKRSAFARDQGKINYCKLLMLTRYVGSYTVCVLVP